MSLPPRGDDAAFLRRLDRAIDRRERRRTLGRATVAVLVVAGLVPLLGPRDRAAPPPAPTAAEARENPVAALLLEAARLRLEGFGDRSAATGRLREIVAQYPGTRAARDAAALLEDAQP